MSEILPVADAVLPVEIPPPQAPSPLLIAARTRYDETLRFLGVSQRQDQAGLADADFVHDLTDRKLDFYECWRRWARRRRGRGVY